MIVAATETGTRMTAEEFLDWVQLPENANGWFDLVRGEVIPLPAPTLRHGRVCMNIGFALELFVRQRRKGYITSNDSGVILERDPDTVRGPDLALYEDAKSWNDLHPKYGENPPVLAVEVLSPSDKATQVTRKINDYLNAGVKLVWIVDYEERCVIVHRPNSNPLILALADELIGGDELPGFVCKVADFFFVPE